MRYPMIHLREKSGIFTITFTEQDFPLNLEREKLITDIRHNPATKEEIERLILMIENELEKYSDVFNVPQGLSVESELPSLAEIARLGFGSIDGRQIHISREQIELLFNRFSRVVNGYPAKAEGLPETADFAVYLTLIREIMHHWHIERLSVLIA